MASLLKSVAVVGLSLGITAASPAYRLEPRTLQARWTYDVCNNCSLYNVPAPDKDSFNTGPIGNWRADRDYGLCLGDPAACSVKSKVTLDFVGLSLYLNFSQWPTGYEYQEAKVFLAPMGVGYGPSFSPAPTDLTPQYTCTVSPDRTAATCSVPFSTLTGVDSSDPSVLFGAMCPLGSIEALDFYVAYSGLVKTPSGQTMPFSQAYPCTNYVSGQCTAYCTSCNYAEMSYRCTSCNVPCPSSSTTQTTSTSTTSSTTSTSTTTSTTSSTTSTSTTTSTTSSTTSTSTTSTSTTPSTTSTTSTSTSSSTTTSSTPTPTVCSYGTAFGYRDASNSITLNTQSGNGCNRWGWYTTPTLAELQTGISGSLLVGAGGNNVGAATNVGTWTAAASPTGGVTVTYSLVPPYTLSEVHIDLDCLPIDTCAPGRYTFGSPAFPAAGRPVYANPTPLQYPTCSGGSRAYLIVHAAVLVSQASGPCGAAVAQ